MHLVAYIDNILILAESKEKDFNQAEGMVYLLDCLGFVINKEISDRSESDYRISGPDD